MFTQSLRKSRRQPPKRLGCFRGNFYWFIDGIGMTCQPALCWTRCRRGRARDVVGLPPLRARHTPAAAPIFLRGIGGCGGGGGAAVAASIGCHGVLCVRLVQGLPRRRAAIGAAAGIVGGSDDGGRGEGNPWTASTTPQRPQRPLPLLLIFPLLPLFPRLSFPRPCLPSFRNCRW